MAVQAEQASALPAQDDAQVQAALAALTVVLLAGVSAQAVAGYASVILAPLGLPSTAVVQVVSLFGPHPLGSASAPRGLVAGDGQAERWMAATSAPRRAAYILAAARRLVKGGSLVAERRYFNQHVGAERARRQAAGRVDTMASLVGPTRAAFHSGLPPAGGEGGVLLLGWYAVLDSSTTADCRDADGHNFHADRPPAMGWPGAVHPFCRCWPGPPHPGGELLD